MSPGDRVPEKMRYGFAVGNFGIQFIFSTVTIYYVYFLTDVALLSAATAGLVLTFSRLWDAVTDPAMGYLTDRTKTRWGGRRPYIFFGVLPLAVSFGFLFIVPDWTPTGLTLYYVSMMMLMWSCFTLVSVPYNALLASLTHDSQERGRIAGLYQILTMLALIGIGGGVHPFLDLFPNEREGFAMIGVLCAAIATISLLITFFTVEERVSPGIETHYSPRDVFNLLLNNRPFVVLCLVGFFCFLVITAVASVLNYFFKYNLQNESLMAVALICIYLVGALSVPGWVAVSRRIGKRQAFTAGLALFAMTFACVYFLRSTNLAILVPVFVLCGVGVGAINLSMWSMLPDTVEYGQWRSGARSEGLQYGVFILITKLGTSAAALLVGFGLEWSGYEPNAAQSAEALYGIRMLSSFVPLAFTLIAIALLQMYRLDAIAHASLRERIAESQAKNIEVQEPAQCDN